MSAVANLERVDTLLVEIELLLQHNLTTALRSGHEGCGQVQDAELEVARLGFEMRRRIRALLPHFNES